MEIELGSEYVGIPVVRSPFVDNSEGSGRTGITPSDIAYCSNDVRQAEHKRWSIIRIAQQFDCYRLLSKREFPAAVSRRRI